jgi:hypothetical protein
VRFQLSKANKEERGNEMNVNYRKLKCAVWLCDYEIILSADKRLLYISTQTRLYYGRAHTDEDDVMALIIIEQHL